MSGGSLYKKKLQVSSAMTLQKTDISLKTTCIKLTTCSIIVTDLQISHRVMSVTNCVLEKLVYRPGSVLPLVTDCRLHSRTQHQKTMKTSTVH